MKKLTEKRTLTRACIKDAFHQKIDLEAHTSSELLETILQELKNMILRSDSVKIVSFGTFLVHNKKARMGRNPKTKIEAEISARKSVSFRPSIALRSLVNKMP